MTVAHHATSPPRTSLSHRIFCFVPDFGCAFFAVPDGYRLPNTPNNRMNWNTLQDPASKRVVSWVNFISFLEHLRERAFQPWGAKRTNGLG